MSQKVAIIILLLVLVVAMFGLYIFAMRNKTLPSIDNQNTQQGLVEPVVNNAPSVTPEIASTTPKRPPTEEEISATISSTMKQISDKSTTKPLTAEELRFIRNPRQEVIKELSK
jgi:hypothetical protein